MNYFIYAVKQYAVFKGRTSRKEYWMFILFYLIFSIAIGVIEGLIGLGDMGILSGLYSLALFIPLLSINVRRMHDVGKSGWWVLMPYIFIALSAIFLALVISSALSGSPTPGLGVLTIVLLIVTAIVMVLYILLLVKKGDEGTNKYGPAPSSSESVRKSPTGESIREAEVVSEEQQKADDELLKEDLESDSTENNK